MSIGNLVPRRRVLALVPALALMVSIAGCGGDSTGYRLSGKVTFNNQPIPVGTIYFDPDGSKGNSGASGFAQIKDGAFDTSAAGGQGTIGGPMVVRIVGLDGVKIDEERVNGKPLFPEYRTEVELPKENSTMDFEVPASAAAARR